MFDRLRGWLAGEKLTLSAAVQQWLRGDEEPGISLNVNRPMAQSVWVYRCIRDISETLAGVPLQLSRAGGNGRAGGARRIGRSGAGIFGAGRKALLEDIVETGPAAELIQRPADGLTTAGLLRRSLMLLEHDGDVFWLFPKIAARRPQLIEIVPRSQMAAARAEGGRGALLGWVRTRPTGRTETIDVDDAIHLRLDSPYDDVWGLSPALAYRLSMEADVAAATWNKVAFANNAEPGVVLSFPGMVTPEQAKQALETWNSRHRGPGKAKGTSLLGGGGKAEAFASSHVEMQYLEGRRFSREEAAAAYGVPLERLSGLQNSNRATGQVGERAYWMQTLIPLGNYVAEVLTELARRFDAGLEAWFDFASVPVLQEMFRENIEAGVRLIEKGATFTQINELFDWGLEPKSWQDEWWVPMGLVPARFTLEGGGPEMGPVLPEGEQESFNRNAGGVRVVGNAEGVRVLPLPDGRGSDSAEPAARADDRRDRIWRAWIASWRGLEKRAQRMLIGLFRRQEREVLRRIEASPDVHRGRSPGPRTGRLADIGILDRILLDVQEENGVLRRIAASFVSDGIELGIGQGIDEAAPAPEAPDDLRVRILNEPLTRERQRRIVAKLAGVNRETMARLRQTLTEGINNGETVQELAGRVRESFATSPVRALRIARTELGMAVSTGRARAFEAVGIDGKCWLDARDEAVRPEHRQAGRDYADPIPIDEPFIVGGEAMMHPCDPSGSAGNIINCRCVELARRLPRRNAEFGLGILDSRIATAEGGCATIPNRNYEGRRFWGWAELRRAREHRLTATPQACALAEAGADSRLEIGDCR